MTRTVVITCEHGGAEVPAEYESLFSGAEDVLTSHRGWDPGSLAAARLLADALEAPLVSARVTRLLIDLNRTVGNKGLLSEYTKDLKDSAKQKLIRDYYQPHRDKVERELASVLAQNGRGLHLAVHSFTPVFQGVTRRADIGLLYDPARKSERLLCREWVARINAEYPDLSVRRNYPYRGASDGLTKAMRKLWPDHVYTGIEIELNHGPWFEDKARWNRMIESLLAGLK